MFENNEERSSGTREMMKSEKCLLYKLKDTCERQACKTETCNPELGPVSGVSQGDA